MEITTATPYAPDHLDKILSPEDKVIFQCASCETYLLPRELVRAFRQMRGDDGEVHSEIKLLCPVCGHFDKEKPVESDFVTLTREQYETRRKYERSGLISPEQAKLIH